MGIVNLYRSSINGIKAGLEPDRPDKPVLGDEGDDLGGGQSMLSGLAVAGAYIPSDQELIRAYRKKALWYPWAVRVATIKSRGTFAGGYPAGGIFHFNAGRNNPVSTMESGRKNGYLYSACGRLGEHVQSNPFSQWGYHAGKSAAKIGGKLRSGVSQYLHGVEVSAAGSVTKMSDGNFKPWFWRGSADTLKADDVRYMGPHAGQSKGGDYYHKFTAAQEESMTRFWLWMKANNPDVFQLEQVYGHDEVATPFGRKSDPGGALSMPMDAYRDYLLKRYKELNLK